MIKTNHKIENYSFSELLSVCLPDINIDIGDFLTKCFRWKVEVKHTKHTQKT